MNHGKRIAIGVAAAVIAVACGGKVTFVTGGTGGEGGAAPNECFVGHCNEGCIKCVGDQCVNGKCDAKGICQPPGTAFTCP